MLLNVMDGKGLPMLSGIDAYYIDNALIYAGAVRGVPDFYWSGVQTILFDVGNRGGVLPAGCEWY